ncbi:MAG: TIGR02646 family protein [Gammaproteobacteria bacterium]|nr:TIGR02646 family protein [Boseongicola sp. SB0665_bin_10]MYG66646.1 TIGR02646 family protein [Gammaproteobacteria bacterium]
MRAIVKTEGPRSLVKYRKSSYSDYDNYPNKVELRQALVGEQRGLCCYCMGRIWADASAMKIEHWQCQDRYPHKQLDYRNLLGACKGGEGQPFSLQHCDTRKGNSDLLRNPAEPTDAIENWVQYGANGTIKSNDVTFDSQLNGILNLNIASLMNHRKGVLDVVLEWWKKEKAKLRGPVPRERIEREIGKHAPACGQLAPYRQVAVWWLRQKL